MLLEKLTKQTYLLTHDKGTLLSQGKEGSRSHLCVKHFADSGSKKYFNPFRPNEGKQRDAPAAALLHRGFDCECWVLLADGGTVGWRDPACGQD